LRKLKEDLKTAKQDYQKSLQLANEQVHKYRQGRKERQLHAFLDNFDVARANIKGIGPARIATLKSFGIDTAADVVPAKVLSVPGFGPENSKGLIAWRTLVEKKFVYQSAENDIDRQEIFRIHGAAQAKLAKLRSTLSAGYSNLTNSSVRTFSLIGKEDPEVKAAFRNMMQARVDLEFLQISIPNTQVSRPVSATGASTTRTSPTPRSVHIKVSRTKASVNCPRCGSSMVNRLARKGRNAGNYFWGCSRFPACKGTRN
jgi:predicted RNA-binding Zn-ribbon protein involved in translation (DUF1610 family)